MSAKLVTQADIAQKLSLSKSTVSRALNGDFRIPSETRRRVEDAARSSGYGKLEGKPWGEYSKSGILGIKKVAALVRTSILQSFFSEVFLHIAGCGQELGFGFEIVTANSHESVIQGIERCRRTGADAVTIFTWEDLDEVAAQEIQSSSIPILLIGRHVECCTNAITFDDYSAGVQAARYLYNLGHRHMAYITGPQESSSQRERFAGFRMGLERLGCYNSNLVTPPISDDVVGDTRSHVQQLLALPMPPTAIWAMNDLVAGITIATIQMAGQAVPKDISVMGFNHDYATTGISLTTFDFRGAELGRQAVFLLGGLVRGEIKGPTRICIAPMLVQGSSTGPPPLLERGCAV